MLVTVTVWADAAGERRDARAFRESTGVPVSRGGRGRRETLAVRASEEAREHPVVQASGASSVARERRAPPPSPPSGWAGRGIWAPRARGAPPGRWAGPGGTGTPVSRGNQDHLVTLDSAFRETRDHRGSRALRVAPESAGNQASVTKAPQAHEGPLGSRASTGIPGNQVYQDLQDKLYLAAYLVRPETPGTLEYQELQAPRDSRVSQEVLVARVSTVPKERGEAPATEEHPGRKVSLALEETPDFQGRLAAASTEPQGRTVCPGVPVRRASPERCWGPRPEPRDRTDFQGPPETRARLGTTADPDRPVWMLVWEYLELKESAVTTVSPDWRVFPVFPEGKAFLYLDPRDHRANRDSPGHQASPGRRAPEATSVSPAPPG